ncbi:hypothetical protein ABZP36_032856 [Zizania latifolia]
MAPRTGGAWLVWASMRRRRQAAFLRRFEAPPILATLPPMPCNPSHAAPSHAAGRGRISLLHGRRGHPAPPGRPPLPPGLMRDLKVKAFKTYHAILNQGYVIYNVKQKLRQDYLGLLGNEIKRLKLSGMEITNKVTVPEIAFTGDTMADFIVDPDNADVLKAKILVVESTFIDDSVTIEHARKYGHTHLFEILSQCEKLENKAIMLIHFSARYTIEVFHYGRFEDVGGGGKSEFCEGHIVRLLHSVGHLLDICMSNVLIWNMGKSTIFLMGFMSEV